MDWVIGTFWHIFLGLLLMIWMWVICDFNRTAPHATCHIVTETLHFLRTKFSDRIVNWPPRSCNLTPLEYSLLHYVRDQVYLDNAQCIEAVKTTIRRVIGEIEPQLCKNVIENFDKGINVCKRGHEMDITRL